MGAALEFGFFLVSGIRVGEEVVGVAGAHDAGAGEGEGHPGGVDGDPAAAPLFGDVGGGARAAGGVQHQVAGVGGHEDAALDYNISSFNHIAGIGRPFEFRPEIVTRNHSRIVPVFSGIESVFCSANTTGY